MVCSCTSLLESAGDCRKCRNPNDPWGLATEVLKEVMVVVMETDLSLGPPLPPHLLVAVKSLYGAKTGEVSSQTSIRQLVNAAHEKHTGRVLVVLAWGWASENGDGEVTMWRWQGWSPGVRLTG